jgi:hypothetical protein
MIICLYGIDRHLGLIAKTRQFNIQYIICKTKKFKKYSAKLQIKLNHECNILVIINIAFAL